MKIGIFTVCMPDFEPVEAMEVASRLGYDGMEWRVTDDQGDRAKPSFWSGNRTSMTPADVIAKADELKAAAARLNVEMPSLAAYICCADPEAVENAFQAANAIGAGNIRVNTCGFDPAADYKKQIQDNRAYYAEVEKLAKRYNVRALIETHMGLITPTIQSAVQVLEGLDPEHVGIMWDPGNQIYEGRERFDMAIRAAGPYLGEVHVKNAIIRETEVANGHQLWTTTWCPLRKGMVDWYAVVENLRAVNYDGWFMLEDFSNDEPDTVTRLKDDIAFLREDCGIV